MFLSISDEMISQFLSGLITVLALVTAGCLIALVLSGMSKRFPFSRLALVLALTPLCFVNFLEVGGEQTLHLYSMIVILLGVTIDGISFLIEPRPKQVSAQEEASVETEEKYQEHKPDMIVWERAE